MKYQLSISILVSNHIDTIRKCLNSIKPLLTELRAELIVVDTGSTDGSIDVAKEYTDIIIPFTWCNDFSAARNVGLNAARGEWFMYMDDDEWFEDVSEIIHFFQKENYMSYGRAFYVVRNYADYEGKSYTDTPAMRMFQIVENIQFKHRIHEFINIEPEPLKVFNAYVHHYGYIGNSVEKSRRNIPLLEMELEENPKDIRMFSQLINEYCRIKEFAKVLDLKEHLNRIERGTVNDALYCYAHAKMAECHYHQGELQNAILYANGLLQNKILNAVTEAYLHIILMNVYLDTTDETANHMALQSFEAYIKCIQKPTMSKEEFSQINFFEMGRIFQTNYMENVITVLLQSLHTQAEHDELANILNKYSIELQNENVTLLYKKTTESQQFFDKCLEEYPLALSTYKKITQIADSALEQQDYSRLLSLLPYMETDEGYLTFQYISEARQLLRILNIIALEEKYQTNSFAYEIYSKQDLIEKYTLSLFSLRRILFNLSAESCADAESFLLENRLSPFAIYLLAKDELIIPNALFFQNIQELYRSQWNPGETQLFQQLISTFTEA